MLLSHHSVVLLIQSYGAAAVGLVAALKCVGLPVPAEAALVVAAIYAGTSGDLSILAIVAAAATGAILGQLAGYVIGRTAGIAALHRWGGRIGLTADRLMLGRYLFRHHGAKVIILGRFVAILRTLGALLAGANAMPRSRFMVANLLGGCLWASIYGFGAYALGHQMERYARSGALILGAVAVIAITAAVLALRRSEARLVEVARAEEKVLF